MVRLKGEQIRKALANANELAKAEGQSLIDSTAPHLAATRKAVTFLQLPSTPKTYLAVTAILLTARAMHESEELDVLAIQAGDEPRGYSASSIGSTLAAFAKEQGIDLRASSSQPMNNQPFTFKDRLSTDMKVNAKFTDQWQDFMAFADEINHMTSEQAKSCLALLFHMARRADVAAVTVKVKGSGRQTFDKVADAVAQFVADNSDNGKVGQAFAAALLDLVYGKEQVVLGDTADPDASTPGDVQVEEADSRGVWLWTEAKQKVIQTGDITGFLAKVKKVGGERVVYFALNNSTYSGYIKTDAVQKEADRLGIEVVVVESPREAIDLYAKVAPGSFATVASGLLERFRARLVQAGCAQDIVEKFDTLASKHAELN